MGYTKIVQYGNVTELYEYEKDRNTNRRREPSIRVLALGFGEKSTASTYSSLKQKRQKESRRLAKQRGVYRRKKRSVLRTTQKFFRLCHHNNIIEKHIHFFTLTFSYDLSYKEASRHVRRFMERVCASSPEIPVRYISVPELTKKNRFHFHLLVYGIPPEQTREERKTRNFQRLFERGYVDIRYATYTSKGISGYMAKYMAKAFTDERIEGTRVYNCSRNINKITSFGSNTLSAYDDFVPTEEIDEIEKRDYDVPYLGKCLYTKITTHYENKT